MRENGPSVSILVYIDVMSEQKYEILVRLHVLLSDWSVRGWCVLMMLCTSWRCSLC